MAMHSLEGRPHDVCKSVHFCGFAVINTVTAPVQVCNQANVADSWVTSRRMQAVQHGNRHPGGATSEDCDIVTMMRVPSKVPANCKIEASSEDQEVAARGSKRAPEVGRASGSPGPGAGPFGQPARSASLRRMPPTSGALRRR